MAAKPRCKECSHRPGPRRVTATRKKHKGAFGEPRLHKKPCHCACHQEDI